MLIFRIRVKHMVAEKEGKPNERLALSFSYAAVRGTQNADNTSTF